MLLLLHGTVEVWFIYTLMGVCVIPPSLSWPVMPAPPVLMLSHHVVGSGQEWGGLTVEFTNHAPHTVEVLYLEMVPWFFRLYLHTLSVSGGMQGREGGEGGRGGREVTKLPLSHKQSVLNGN